MVIVLNGIDWAAFELLNIRNPATETIPTHFRALDGLFQALAVRSGGFYVVNISTLVRTSLHSVLIPLNQQCILAQSIPLTSPPAYRPPSPLRNNDVHLRLPRRNHHAPLQRLRRALSRNLRRRRRFFLPTPKTRQFPIQHPPSHLYLRRSSIFYATNAKTATKSVCPTADQRAVEP
jgi:hypothetical protein